MGGGDLVSERGLGGGGRSRRLTGGWGRKLEGVGVGDHGFREKGAVALEKAPVSVAMEGPGGDLGRCAKRVANGAG